MSKRVQAGVLAAAALASIAVAGVRIAGAAGHHANALEEETRAYATATALAAATLAKLRTPPPGFHADRCISPTPGSECFSRSRSMPLSHATMGRLVASFGVKRYSVYGGDPIACFRTKHFNKPRLTLQACHAEALAGDERVVLYATSLVVSGPYWVRGTTRTLPDVPYPSELEMDAIGRLSGN